MKAREFKLSNLNDLLLVTYLKKFIRNKPSNFFSVFNNTVNCRIGSPGWLTSLGKRTAGDIPVLDHTFDVQI